MPIYIVDSRVDWGWGQRTEAERAIVRRYQPRLDSSNHGRESFSGLLREASTQLPDVPIRALIEEETGSRTLLLAQAGAVTIVPGDSAEHAPLIETLLAANKSELFPVLVTARERAAAAGGSKLEQALYFPEPLLAEIQRQAVRTDRSLSSIVQHAWQCAREQIRGLADREQASRLQVAYLGADKRKQTLYFPGEMLAEIEEQAARLDSSSSWVVQLALAISRQSIAALPSLTE